MAGVAPRRFPALAVAAMTLLALRPAVAQAVADRILAGVQLAVQTDCAILKVDFNIRIRYASHFPLEGGNELRIRVTPADRNKAAAAALTPLLHEDVAVPDGRQAGINAVNVETRGPDELVLRIRFDHAVAYQVAPDSETRSIVIAIAGAGPSEACRPVFPAAAPTASAATGQHGADARATIQPGNRSAGTISQADLRVAAASMDEGRAALKRNNPGAAIRLFTKVLKYPENQYSVEAQELLGLARQKNGQIAEAKAEYEDYLRRYPGGEESERVRQRLAGIVTAAGEAGAALRAPSELPAGALPVGKFTQTRETNWTLVGSVSSFYIHDDSFNTARDTSLAPTINSNIDDHSVHQNEILTTFDTLATWNNDQTSGKIRVSTGEEHRFSTNQSGYQVDEIGVSALSLDATVKDWNLRTLAGRQTFNGDGVFGRFDGALFSWQALPWLKFDLVGGSPANSRYFLPFMNQRYFYGGALGFGPLFGGLETSIYFNEGRSQWLVDREAVGSDIRYADQNKFVFGTLDYDVRFQQLNAAVFSGSLTLPNTMTTIYGGADYRRVPFLSAWNALFYQPFSNIYDFLKAQNAQGATEAQVDQLAISQTPVYKSAMIGFSHPLTDKLTVSADATYANLSRTVPPTGLDPALASLAAGNEYYLTTQLIANNIFKDGDMYIGAFHYAQQETNTQYVLDFNTRYPVINDLMLAPRLRLGYSVFTGTDVRQYTVLPSLLVDYNWNSNLTFEAELGTQWTRSVQPGIKTSDVELFGTIGFRYRFDVDGGTKAADRSRQQSPAAAAICRYTVRPDGSCTTPSPGRS